MLDHGLGWRCWWQDFRGFRTKDVRQPVPAIQWLDFRDRAEAERECQRQRWAGMTVHVTPVPLPKAGRHKHNRLPLDMPTIPPAERNPRERRFT